VKQWTVESEERKLIKKGRKEERGIEGRAVIVEEQTAGRPPSNRSCLSVPFLYPLQVPVDI